MYCGHEYTAANLRFALTVDPANRAALEYQRQRRAPTRHRCPELCHQRMSLEIAINPFLRCDVARGARCRRNAMPAGVAQRACRCVRGPAGLEGSVPLTELREALTDGCRVVANSLHCRRRVAARRLRPSSAERPPRERIVLPPTQRTGGRHPGRTPRNPATGATPSLTMPREWQHHNGEDYDDLFDRMRAGFAFDEVQEPAIDQQLAWFEHNPDYLERCIPARPALHVPRRHRSRGARHAAGVRAAAGGRKRLRAVRLLGGPRRRTVAVHSRPPACASA